MMKILLVNPPVPVTYYNREYYVPSNLMYLASILQDNDCDVRILDLKVFMKYETQDNVQVLYIDILIDTISEFQPDLIGLGCLYSGNFPDVLRFAQVIKEKFEKIPIVIGGIHPTIYASRILADCPSIDWIILGEGEESILSLVNTLKNKQYEFEKIDGFAYRKNGKVFVNPKTRYIQNLDTIPFPAYNLIELKDYYVDTSGWHNPKGLPINTSIPVISSRSCPYRCNFCSMFMVMGPRWRARSPRNVVDEIEYVYYRYNHRHFSFMDDNFILSKPRILEICREINKRNLDIQFETPNGLSMQTLDEEVLDALVSAGLVRIYLAIESGSDFIRNKVMKKNISRKRIFEIVQIAKNYKQLYVNAFFIIGMPEETKETLMDTYNMIRDIDINKIHIHNIIPYPCTQVFEQAMRDGLLVNIDVTNLYKLPDFYFKANKFFIKPYNLEVEDLEEFKEKINRLIAVQKSKKVKSPVL